MNGTYRAFRHVLFSSRPFLLLIGQQKIGVDDLEADVLSDGSHDNSLTALAARNDRLALGIFDEFVDRLREALPFIHDRHGLDSEWGETLRDLFRITLMIRIDQIKSKEVVVLAVVLVLLDTLSDDLTLEDDAVGAADQLTEHRLHIVHFCNIPIGAVVRLAETNVTGANAELVPPTLELLEEIRCALTVHLLGHHERRLGVMLLIKH